MGCDLVAAFGAGKRGNLHLGKSAIVHSSPCPPLWCRSQDPNTYEPSSVVPVFVIVEFDHVRVA